MPPKKQKEGPLMSYFAVRREVKPIVKKPKVAVQKLGPEVTVKSSKSLNEEERVNCDNDALPFLDEHHPSIVQFTKKYQIGMKRIGGSKLSPAETVLVWFDGWYSDLKYGPGVGMLRVDRWERAQMLGLDPPQIVKTILETKQGVGLYRIREHCMTALVYGN
ncbi:hypothetical protein GALMADRAFT_217226 [Galerina marginata CBS 339.88]|uniref:DNA polymerase delta subunit 4 n=1 Tax=Galerina marginata (strain CBS 339.88) TaxID=685588 RepID=A0A067SE62_GALM3|nr:hypothetical protein GALMADRAFT_217226 [Galerina marginata CBS 339.88]